MHWQVRIRLCIRHIYTRMQQERRKDGKTERRCSGLGSRARRLGSDPGSTAHNLRQVIQPVSDTAYLSIKWE